jgi:hypothetical protein
MKKKTIIGLVTVAVLFIALGVINCTEASESETSPEVNYSAYADQLELLKIFESNAPNAVSLIENRNGKLLIEKVIGIVDNANTGDGHVLDNADSYICYKSVDGIRKGNIICTYFIYNPDTNYIDDILMRFDYIIDSMAVE